MTNAISCIKPSLMDEITIDYVIVVTFKLEFENIYEKSRYIEEMEQLKFYDLRNDILLYNTRLCISNV